MCAFSVGAGRRGDEIAAELADILEHRAVPARDVAPEPARRKALGDDDRAAVDQRRADRRDAADAVIHRQAIVHAVVRRHVGEAGEPMAPGDDAMMADGGRLGQAGGARGEDQQRAIGERHLRVARRRRGSLARGRRRPCRCAAGRAPRRHGARFRARARRPRSPRRRPRRIPRRRSAAAPRRPSGNGRAPRRARLTLTSATTAPTCVRPSQMREIFRAIGHHQADRLARGDAGAQSPARILVHALRECAKAEVFALAQAAPAVRRSGAPIRRPRAAGCVRGRGSPARSSPERWSQACAGVETCGRGARRRRGSRSFQRLVTAAPMGERGAVAAAAHRERPRR